MISQRYSSRGASGDPAPRDAVLTSGVGGHGRMDLEDESMALSIGDGVIVAIVQRGLHRTRPGSGA